MPAAAQVARGISRAELGNLEFQHLADGRHGVLDAEDELDMERRLEQALLGQADRLVQHREVEHLDLRLDPERLHAAGKLGDQGRMVLIDDGREVDRTG